MTSIKKICNYQMTVCIFQIRLIKCPASSVGRARDLISGSWVRVPRWASILLYTLARYRYTKTHTLKKIK